MTIDLGALVAGGANTAASYMNSRTAAERQRALDDERRQQVEAQLARAALADQLTRLQIGDKEYEAKQRPIKEARETAEYDLKTETERARKSYYDRLSQAKSQRPGHVVQRADGTYTTVDPTTGLGPEGQPVRGRVPEAAGDRAAAREQARRRAIGRAILASPASGEQVQAFGSAFQGVRAANPHMDPGEVAYYAWEAIKSTRPDLVPATARAQTPQELDPIQRVATEAMRGLTPQAPGQATPQPARTGPMASTERLPGTMGSRGRPSAAPGATTPADRWEQLVDSGMSEAEAEARVRQEFRLPLHPSDVERAQTDPEFRAFLESQGYHIP